MGFANEGVRMEHRIDASSVQVERFEDLTLSDNFMFCKIFTSHPHLCRKLVEVILGRRVKRIVILNKEQDINTAAGARSIRMDVYLEDDTTVYDFEMQINSYRNLPKRSRYYQGIMDVDNLDKGIDYGKLKNTYIVFICLHDPFGLGLPVYTFRNVCRERMSLELGDGAWKVFLNASARVRRKRELDLFLRYLSGKLNLEEIQKSGFVRELGKR